MAWVLVSVSSDNGVQTTLIDAGIHAKSFYKDAIRLVLRKRLGADGRYMIVGSAPDFECSTATRPAVFSDVVVSLPDFLGEELFANGDGGRIIDKLARMSYASAKLLAADVATLELARKLVPEQPSTPHDGSGARSGKAGRPPSITKDQLDEARQLIADGVKRGTVARMVGVHRNSLARLLPEIAAFHRTPTGRVIKPLMPPDGGGT